MPPPLTHEEFRGKVCGVCWQNRKKDTRKISESILENIKTFVYPLYDLENFALPMAICNPCRLQLLKAKKVKSSENISM